MKGFLLLLVLAGVLMAFTVASASADPGSSPQVQYRTFSCDNGNTYSGGFVGFASADFFIVDSTSTFAIKIFTEYTSPGGDAIATFNTGISGFDPSTLVTCSYTDPQGIFNVFSGFLTPRS
jgi:hypothetical protein